MTRLISFRLLVLLFFGPPLVSVANEELPIYLKQSAFRKEIDRPLIVNREAATLREILQNLSQHSRISILLDRRIDPSQRIDVALNASFFDEGIRELVSPVSAGVVVVSDTVFVTQQRNAKLFRTRLALIQQQMEAHVKKEPQRHLALTRRTEMAWVQLTTPREILQGIASLYRLTIENIEEIPHDHWGAGTLTYMNANEGMLVVASQYQLQPEWVDSVTIRFVPEEDHPVLTTDHRLARGASEDLQERIATQIPEMKFEIQSHRITATGLVEQHEELAVLLGARQARKLKPAEATSSLDHHRFSLEMVRQPFSSLLGSLAAQGIELQYDQEELAEAGIDLETKLTLTLNQATIFELLDAACPSVNIDYRLDGSRIHLFPTADRPAEN